MDNDVKYGLSVTGVVHPDHIYGNNQGQPSDVLILTKKWELDWCVMQIAWTGPRKELWRKRRHP